MKKETVNLFNEGLNKDLNPLVTPNNILTDNLNGTFLTFNGDELVLQTDAGNTKIKVTGSEEYVKLSEGFQPLGVKEYGGVLYIVSGNKETNKVEIGSYPAPEFSDDRLLYGTSTLLTQNNIYKSTVINQNDFKTGRYITFTSTSSNNFENITNYQVTKIYNVKLYHQLENGTLDLTNDVWEKFNDHKSKTGDSAIHWLSSTTFKYYCPTQFKGKLLLQVILDEPEYFKLTGMPEISFVDSSDSESMTQYSHKIVFTLDWINSNNISIDLDQNSIELRDSNGSIISAKVSINEKVITTYIPYKVSDALNNNLIPHNVILYKITPKFYYNGTQLGSEVTPTFENKYIVQGTRILEQKYNEIYFNLANSSCVGNNTKEYKNVILYNRDSRLDWNLEPSEKEYVFIKQGTMLDSENQVKLGEFIIENNLPKLVNFTEEAQINLNKVQPYLFEHIKSLLETTNVRVFDSSCSMVNINVKFNLAFKIDSPTSVSTSDGYKLEFYQLGISSEKIPYKTTDSGRTFELNVNTLDDLLVKFDHTIWRGSNTILKTELVKDAYYNFALNTIAENQISAGTRANYSSSTETNNWFFCSSVGSPNIELLKYILENNLLKINIPNKTTTVKVNDYIWNVGLVSLDSSNLIITTSPRIPFSSFVDLGIGVVKTYTLSGIVASGNPINPTKYRNLLNPENFVEIGDETLGFIILPRNINLTTSLT